MGSSLLDGKRPFGLHILRYSAADFRAVRLVPHEAALGLNGGNRFLNLHIINEPDCECGHDDHARNGFERALQLLPGVKKPIFIKNLTTLALERNDDPARGYAAVETLDVIERANMLAQAGLDWRDGQDHLGVVDDILVDAPPFDCLPVISRNT